MSHITVKTNVVHPIILKHVLKVFDKDTDVLNFISLSLKLVDLNKVFHLIDFKIFCA